MVSRPLRHLSPAFVPAPRPGEGCYLQGVDLRHSQQQHRDPLFQRQMLHLANPFCSFVHASTTGPALGPEMSHIMGPKSPLGRDVTDTASATRRGATMIANPRLANKAFVQELGAPETIDHIRDIFTEPVRAARPCSMKATINDHGESLSRKRRASARGGRGASIRVCCRRPAFGRLAENLGARFNPRLASGRREARAQ